MGGLRVFLPGLVDLWERAQGPDRSDLRLGVLTGLTNLIAAASELDTISGWSTSDNLRNRAAGILRQGFDSPDIRIRLKARDTAQAYHLGFGYRVRYVVWPTALPYESSISTRN